MILIAMVLAAGAQTASVYADPEALAAIDRDFVCPERLTGKRAKIRALERFDERMSKAIRNMTAQNLTDGRLYLLRKHRCYVTLRNIERSQR